MFNFYEISSEMRRSLGLVVAGSIRQTRDDSYRHSTNCTSRTNNALARRGNLVDARRL